MSIVFHSIQIIGHTEGEISPPVDGSKVICYLRTFSYYVLVGMKMFRWASTLCGIVKKICSYFLLMSLFYLFGKANLNEAALYADLIKMYCAELGHDVNLKKSYLFFSNHTDLRTRADISILFELENNIRPKKILGSGY